MPNAYPGDSGSVLYSPPFINLIDLAGQPIIITVVAASMPGRGHIRFWSADGDSLGWYVNAGGSSFYGTRDVDGDGRNEAVFMCFNNRMSASALLVLKPDSALGASPPYEDPHLDLGWVRRGNQLAYIVFPVTDLGKVELGNRYNIPSHILSDSPGHLNFYIGESRFDELAQIVYSVDDRYRVIKCWPTDQFAKRRDILVADGRLPQIDPIEYDSIVREAVLYWTDSGWVTEGQLRADER